MLWRHLQAQIQLAWADNNFHPIRLYSIRSKEKCKHIDDLERTQSISAMPHEVAGIPAAYSTLIEMCSNLELAIGSHLCHFDTHIIICIYNVLLCNQVPIIIINNPYSNLFASLPTCGLARHTSRTVSASNVMVASFKRHSRPSTSWTGATGEA